MRKKHKLICLLLAKFRRILVISYSLANQQKETQFVLNRSLELVHTSIHRPVTCIF